MRRCARIALLLSTGLAAFAIAPAAAHDAWLAPEAATRSPGDTLVVRQRFGHDLEVVSEVALDRELTRSFELLTARGRVDLLAEAPKRFHPLRSPVLERAVDFHGPALLAMEHTYLDFESEDRRFREHLEREDLTRALRALDRAPPAPRRRERYARSLKALVNAPGEDAGGVHAWVLGHVFEIVLLDDPVRLRPGDTLRVRVLHAGSPLAGHPVSALARSGDRLVRVRDRTDGWGEARLPLPNAGPWLVRATRTAPCRTCAGAEWESQWASFHFVLSGS